MAIAAITKAGRQKLCKAHAGNIPMSPIVKMVFGDGGLDTEGNVIPTTGEEVSLRNQLLEKEIETRTFLADDTKCQYSVRINEGELTGKAISELGLIDTDGDLVCYKSFLPKVKDEDFAFTFSLTENFPENL